MPQFQWSGRTSDGRTVSGTIVAESEEAALTQLRPHAAVTSISRGPAPASRLGARLGRIVLALALMGGATLMGMISKGSRIQCTRAGAAYDCTIDTTMAGFRTMYTENIRGAQTVSVETQYGHGKRATRSDRLVLSGTGRPLATEWMQSVMPRAEHVAKELNQAFAQQKASAGGWQIEVAPAAVALILAIVGFAVLLRAVASQ